MRKSRVFWKLLITTTTQPTTTRVFDRAHSHDDKGTWWDGWAIINPFSKKDSYGHYQGPLPALVIGWRR